MINPVKYWVFILAVMARNPLLAQQYTTNLDIRIPKLPAPVNIGGKQLIYYEVYATNFGADTIQLKQLQISNGANLDSNDLSTRSARIGTQGKIYSTQLPPGASLVIYLEINLDEKTTHLEHHLLFASTHKTDSVTITTTLPSATPIILGPPLSNGNWAAVYSPEWATGHRRVIYTINGHARIPGRYAIDFIKLDDNGKLAAGNNDEIKQWYGYGAEVLAVADGTIAAVRTDFTETPTISGHDRITPDRATGNYISIKLSTGQYAFYEHLKPGSIRVKPGQTIKKGQPIASLGFTGQSTGPHLHFHVADTNSPLGAEGLPFAFNHFTYTGYYKLIDSLGNSPWTPAGKAQSGIRNNEHPLPNSVIGF